MTRTFEFELRAVERSSGWQTLHFCSKRALPSAAPLAAGAAAAGAAGGASVFGASCFEQPMARERTSRNPAVFMVDPPNHHPPWKSYDRPRRATWKMCLG